MGSMQKKMAQYKRDGIVWSVHLSFIFNAVQMSSTVLFSFILSAIELCGSVVTIKFLQFILLILVLVHNYLYLISAVFYQLTLKILFKKNVRRTELVL